MKAGPSAEPPETTANTMSRPLAPSLSSASIHSPYFGPPSVVHGAVMAVQSVLNPQHIHHLYGDVLALFLIAAVLGFLSPEALRLRFSKKAN